VCCKRKETHSSTSNDDDDDDDDDEEQQEVPKVVPVVPQNAGKKLAQAKTKSEHSDSEKSDPAPAGDPVPVITKKSQST
jgi:hypothetical protein